MKFEMKILDPRAKIPTRGTALSAAVDLCAVINHPVTIHVGVSILIPTGIAVSLGAGYAAMILPRSGLGHKSGLVLGNLVGLIDGDYQGELMISAWNRGHATVYVMPGDRIAQMVVVPIVMCEYIEVAEFTMRTARGEGGFGSTGTS